MSTLPMPSQRLINTLVELESNDETVKGIAKMELIQITRGLVPAGKPAYTEMIRYPKIKDLEEKLGQKTMMKTIFLIIRDFCASINVGKNMNADQMIEAAAILLEEAGNFRLEDYIAMFAMAKRGEYGEFYDRMDIAMICSFIDKYWQQRNIAGTKARDEDMEKIDRIQGIAPATRGELTFDQAKGTYVPQRDRNIEAIGSFLSAIKSVVGAFGEARDMASNDEEKKLTKEVTDQKIKKEQEGGNK